MDGLDGLAQALGITDRKDADWHVLAKVSAVNPDGSLTVYMAGSLNPTSIDAYCDAQAGDVVCVLISKGKARAIARRGGAMPHAVLYDDAVGTTGTVTLSHSAASYEYIRVFVKDNNGYGMSVDVFEPDGKTFTAMLPYPDGSSAFWINGTVWSISGASITNARHGNAEIKSSYVGGGNNIAITRVEAW